MSEEVAITAGHFDSEPLASKAFLDVFDNDGMEKYMTVAREVVGRYTSYDPRMERPSWECDKNPRIDIVLIPTPLFVSEGWRLGCVGVEIKKSGVPLGKVVCQCLDYSKAVFRIPVNGVVLQAYLNWIFIWPAKIVRGSLQSIMANNRIGIVKPGDVYSTITFNADGKDIVTFERWTIPVVSHNHPKSGNKVGSR